MRGTVSSARKRRARPFLQRGLLCCALLPLTLLGTCFSRQTTSLPIEIDGCEELYREAHGLRCEVGIASEAKLHLAVRGAPGGRLLLRTLHEDGRDKRLLAAHDHPLSSLGTLTLTVDIESAVDELALDLENPADSAGPQPAAARCIRISHRAPDWVDQHLQQWRAAREKRDGSLQHTLLARMQGRLRLEQNLARRTRGTLVVFNLLTIRADDESGPARATTTAEQLTALAEILRGTAQTGGLVSESRAAVYLAYLLAESEQRTALPPAFADKPEEKARRELARLERMTELPAYRAEAFYLLGRLAARHGQFREALSLLEAAEDCAQRIGDLDNLVQIRPKRIALLQEFQRDQEAASLADSNAQQARALMRPCERAFALATTGWRLLLRWESAPEGASKRVPEKVEDSLPDLVAAYRIFQHECPDPIQEANVLATLARAAAQPPPDASSDALRQRLESAEAYIRLARERFPEPSQVIEQDLLVACGRVALQRGDADGAQRCFSRLLNLAQKSDNLPYQYLATTGLARTLEQQGNEDKALAAYNSAEALLPRLGAQVPFGEGRSKYLSQYEGATRRHLQLLFTRGDAASALALIRRVRLRVVSQFVRSVRPLSDSQRAQYEQPRTRFRALRQDQERIISQIWQQPPSQLPLTWQQYAEKAAAAQQSLDLMLRAQGSKVLEPAPLPQEDLVLACHPLPAKWLCVAALNREHLMFAVDDIDPAAPRKGLADRLLIPLRPLLSRARSVRVLGYGELREVPIGALPLDGKPLILHKPVVRALDITALAAPAPRAEQRGALGVVNPQSNLQVQPEVEALLRRFAPAVRLRVPAIANLVGDPSQPVEVGAPPLSPVSSLRLLPEIEQSGLFLFFGHADSAPLTGPGGKPLGLGGWSSALHLARGMRVVSGDLLASESVPERVLLIACRTGRDEGSSPSEEMNLVNAFLGAGSQIVIGTTRQIPEEAGVAMLRALLQNGAFQEGADLVLALQAAQQQLWQQQAQVDWEAFEAFVP